MTNPITDLLARRRAPAAIVSDLDAIARVIGSVSPIETLLASLVSRSAPSSPTSSVSAKPSNLSKTGSRTSNR